jgi:cytoskeletal protein CcmA (bactofilin family)
MRGDIRARRVIVEGTVQGNLHALESVTIRPGATVNGDVYAQRVAIEQGARLCGRIDMDNAPAVPRIGAAGGGTADPPRELTDREVGELLAGS